MPHTPSGPTCLACEAPQGSATYSAGIQATTTMRAEEALASSLALATKPSLGAPSPFLRLFLREMSLRTRETC